MDTHWNDDGGKRIKEQPAKRSLHLPRRLSRTYQLPTSHNKKTRANAPIAIQLPPSRCCFGGLAGICSALNAVKGRCARKNTPTSDWGMRRLSATLPDSLTSLLRIWRIRVVGRPVGHGTTHCRRSQLLLPLNFELRKGEVNFCALASRRAGWDRIPKLERGRRADFLWKVGRLGDFKFPSARLPL